MKTDHRTNSPRTDPTRRRLVTVLAGAAALSASPALAQFSFSFGGGSSEDEGGGGINLNKLFDGAKALFEGISMGEEDEISMGNYLFGRLVDRSGGAYPNRRVQSSIERFSADLIATSERPNLPWEIVVLNDNTVNAWCMPGGKIAINKGLLRYTAEESELAAVISHEIGHAELSHGITALKSERFRTGISTLARESLNASLEESGGALTNTMFDLMEGPMLQMLRTGYSRKSEDEADLHILKVFEKTGHDPVKAPNFFRTLLEIMPPDSEGTTSLYSTHPGTVERIERLEQAAGGLPSPDASPHPQDFAAIKRTFPTRRKYRRSAG